MSKKKQYYSLLKVVIISSVSVLGLALFVPGTVRANLPERNGNAKPVTLQEFSAQLDRACSGPALPALTTLRTVVMLMQMPPAVAAPKAAAPTPASSPDSVVVLHARRHFALGMIETGNNDAEIGGAGEVSRYQIMPSVWRSYSQSHDYQNPQVSLAVARKHWASLYGYFKQKTGREPSDFDMYVLWNTRYGYYASKGFKPDRLHPVVRNRAERFVNLVEHGAA